MIREALSNINEAKLPKLIQELKAWVEIVYPEAEQKDFPANKSKRFPNYGSTSFTFNTGKKGKDFLDKMSKIPKYESLLWGWAGNVIEVNHPQFHDKIKMTKDEFSKWSIDTRKHGSFYIKSYKSLGKSGSSFIFNDKDKLVAYFIDDREMVFADKKTLKMFK